MRAGRGRVAGVARRPARRRSPTASTRPSPVASSTRSTTRATRAYSAEALERFALLAARAAHAAHATSASRCSTWSAGSSTTTGIDVELASSVSPAAAARRDNLDLFVKAVAEFQAVDGDVTPAGAARLPRRPRTSTATASTSRTPTEADSVKLLTVHRAKGLEWDVGLPRRGVRPSSSRPTRSADAVDVLAVGAAGAAARRRADLPAARRPTTARRSRPTAPPPRRTRRREELPARLRRAHPGPRTGWSSRRYSGARGATPLGPSDYQEIVRERWPTVGRDRRLTWLDKPPAKGDAQPATPTRTR